MSVISCATADIENSQTGGIDLIDNERVATILIHPCGERQAILHHRDVIVLSVAEFHRCRLHHSTPVRFGGNGSAGLAFFSTISMVTCYDR